jgi:hypothetical protein
LAVEKIEQKNQTTPAVESLASKLSVQDLID